jgi:hypothetical protein
MERARQVRAHLHPEALSTRKQVKLIGTVHASEEWLMALVVRNFERHSLVSSIQKRNPRELTASRNFKICKPASERTLKSMLTVGLLCSFFDYMRTYWSFIEIANDDDEEKPSHPESSSTDKVDDDAAPKLNSPSKPPIEGEASSQNEV